MAEGQPATSLTQMTVDLVPHAVVSLREAAARCGDNPSDTVNRALQTYEQITAAVETAQDTGTPTVVHLANVTRNTGQLITITITTAGEDH